MFRLPAEQPRQKYFHLETERLHIFIEDSIREEMSLILKFVFLCAWRSMKFIQFVFCMGSSYF